MPIPTPFHERTASLCTSMRWKEWSGYYAVCSYRTYVEAEYFALRHAVGLVDVTPLHKYDVRGPDAAAYLARIMVRDITKLKHEQVYYCCWCDEDGKVVDDGTVWRIEDDFYRVTSTEPALWWLERYARGFDVTVVDVGAELATLSVQGPNARDLLEQCCDADLDALRFFHLTHTRFDGFDALVTRTGYTGDLGFEVWVANENALRLYDLALDAGKPFGLLPVGLDGQDVCRIEAGFVLNGVDYYPAPHCLIEARKSTPFELGFDWMVKLERDPFNGQAALRAEKVGGPQRVLVGLDIDWDAYTALYAEHGLPPELCTEPWRGSIPVYDLFGKQVGYANSGTWSPTLKKNIAMATVLPAYTDIGTELRFEITVEHQRRKCKATVTHKPFFAPKRTRFTPGKR